MQIAIVVRMVDQLAEKMSSACIDIFDPKDSGTKDEVEANKE